MIRVQTVNFSISIRCEHIHWFRQLNVAYDGSQTQSGWVASAQICTLLCTSLYKLVHLRPNDFAFATRHVPLSSVGANVHVHHSVLKY